MIRCHLRVAHLDENPDFDAISYSWRKDTAAGFIGARLFVIDAKRYPRFKAIHGRGCAIMCDNQLLRIQENLYDFLLHLRRRKSGRSLWIDAICIDQGTYDDKDKEKEKEDEKLNQILIMGRIYNSATSVLVWLGEATSSTKTGVWFMEQLRSSPTKYEGHYKGPNVLKRLTQKNPSMAGMFDLLELDSDINIGLATIFGFFKRVNGIAGFETIMNRDYLERSWVLQEMILAKELHFFIGSKEIPPNEFIRAINWLSQYSGAINLGMSQQVGTPSALAFPDIIKTRENYQKKEPLSLEECVSMCRERKATVKRDKVYAILGLLKDTTLSELGSSATAEEIYMECAKELVKEAGWFHVFSLVGRSEADEAELEKRIEHAKKPTQGETKKELETVELENLPSWIPDFSTLLRPQPFWAHGCPAFSAASPIQSEFEIITEGENNNKIWTLCLSAADVDTIEQFAETDALLSMTGYRFLKGHLLDLVTQLPVRYITGEPTIEALIRTLTADVFRGSNIVFSEVRDGFFEWIATEFGLAGVIQGNWFWKSYSKMAGSLITGPHVRAEAKLFEDSDLTLPQAIESFALKHGSYGPSTEFAEALYWCLPEKQKLVLREKLVAIKEEGNQRNDQIGTAEPSSETPPIQADEFISITRRRSADNPNKECEQVTEAGPSVEPLLANSKKQSVDNDTVEPDTAITNPGSTSTDPANPSDPQEKTIQYNSLRPKHKPEHPHHSNDFQNPNEAANTKPEEIVGPSEVNDSDSKIDQLTPFKTAIDILYKDRRLFRTTNDYLGIGPATLRKGDKVMLVAGADVPYIFRSRGEKFKFIGSAYVHGIMYGEYLKKSPEPEFSTRYVI